MFEIQKGNKYETIISRTFGGFIVFLYNIFFDIQDELFFKSKNEAERYVELFLDIG
jgi:hypothetical protein